MQTSIPMDVADADFGDQVLERSRRTPVVVDFWAGWCQPCLVLGPVLERVAAEHGGRVALVKVDVDANPRLAAAYRIQGIPAVKAFRDAAVVSEFVGVQPEASVRAFFADLVPSDAEPLVERAAAAEAAGDLAGAEAAYRAAVEADPGHDGAIVGLAGVLAEVGGRDEEAVTLLARISGAAAARPVRARLELRAMEASEPAGLAYAAAAALRGDAEDALDRCLELVRAGGDGRDRARTAMVAIFDLLGDDHPLTATYRARLASALF